MSKISNATQTVTVDGIRYACHADGMLRFYANSEQAERARLSLYNPSAFYVWPSPTVSYRVYLRAAVHS